MEPEAEADLAAGRVDLTDGPDEFFDELGATGVQTTSKWTGGAGPTSSLVLYGGIQQLSFGEA